MLLGVLLHLPRETIPLLCRLSWHRKQVLEAIFHKVLVPCLLKFPSTYHHT